ncbi:glyoxylase-like metal-dependent hydrolase (beta-lactamase superfamily II) [Streptomyces sp. SAI-135]|uniref:MBL fold metallo-hydrolase n=1 Tax=unclassified Streptomyces TaxID=2593676 RepID=UPI0024738785|nr:MULTISPECIES: MBL fold metallo-hydrolase [unclassified Streptomyces]MDH6521800.1 glyoxylase-like metal-dependent hydrolase (beta-lactamase superfamily II) [Streptomyces sp. SAI-090]MDH6554089.1 glyoxylase-like metal-dependent hydrolase (beta-lactamase superfamily II) [Streptomyces sp. SAI-041]MDH6573166.1 glyoxylase-like metal-dependent hydrolase (beta-lactamase superfamily II) [Streptomyces sp. SAI-117]MDH6614099.1 glyoxylase-like metal-dependent hydrolase (beta-lactamase superfamily II) [S
MNGTMTVIDRDAVRIHSYMAPDDSLNVTTQLIETPARLIAVDAQYTLSYADEVVAYARGLGKPLDRVIITHAHPDHFHGAARFGAPVHALAAVREQIAAQGDGQDPTGAVIPVADITPTIDVAPGTEVIDGIPFVFEAHHGGEAPDQLAIKLPEQGVLVAQDLVYHATHLFLGNNDIPGWTKAVEQLAADPAYDTVLPGHGLPAGPEVFDQLRRYLTDAAELLGDDGEAYKRAITARHTGFGGTFLIDIGNQYLFGTDNT